MLSLVFELELLSSVLRLLLLSSFVESELLSGITFDEFGVPEFAGLEVVMSSFPPHAVSNITKRTAIAVMIAKDFFIINIAFPATKILTATCPTVAE